MADRFTDGIIQSLRDFSAATPFAEAEYPTLVILGLCDEILRLQKIEEAAHKVIDGWPNDDLLFDEGMNILSEALDG